MWPFKPAPVVTNAAFARWLRAQRPPWLWFLGLDEDHQETLATIGDGDREATADALVAALADAQGEAEPQDEESLVRRVAAGFAEHIVAAREKARRAPQAAPQQPDPPTPESFGAFTPAPVERRTGRKTFLGREADPKPEPEPAP